MDRLFILFIVLISCTFSTAAENFKKAGNKALQFEVDGNNLLSGGTFGIAFKYWPYEKIAFRLGVKYDDYTSDRDMVDGTDLQKNLGSSIQFSAEHQLYSARQFSLYWGGRLAYNFNKYSRDYSRSSDLSSQTVDNGYLVGVLLGAEYWLNERFSLSAYHSVHLQRLTSRSEERGSSLGQTTDRLSTATSRLILSVYF